MRDPSSDPNLCLLLTAVVNTWVSAQQKCSYDRNGVIKAIGHEIYWVDLIIGLINQIHKSIKALQHSS